MMMMMVNKYAMLPKLTRARNTLHKTLYNSKIQCFTYTALPCLVVLAIYFSSIRVQKKKKHTIFLTLLFCYFSIKVWLVSGYLPI